MCPLKEKVLEHRANLEFPEPRIPRTKREVLQMQKTRHGRRGAARVEFIAARR